MNENAISSCRGYLAESTAAQAPTTSYATMKAINLEPLSAEKK
jgi:hypothetical protein